MNIEMIYQLVLIGIILLFGILYMRLLFKYKQCMQAFYLKKRRLDFMEKELAQLYRENSDLQKVFESENIKHSNEWDEFYRKHRHLGFKVGCNTEQVAQYVEQQNGEGFNEKFCNMCSNALVVDDLTHDNDFSSISVGDVDNGYRMSINSGNRRPVCIDVEKWDEQTKQNIVIARYYPKFCPNCGRLLFEYRVKTE